MKTKTKIIIAVAVAVVLLGAVITVGLLTQKKNKPVQGTTFSSTPSTEDFSFPVEQTTLFDWEEYREQLLSSDVSSTVNPSDVTAVSDVTGVSAVQQPLNPTVYVSYVYVDPGYSLPVTEAPAATATTEKKVSPPKTTSAPQNEMIDFQYTFDSESKSVTLNKYTGSETTVIIPPTVNGNKIVKVGSDCFKGKSLELVYIGKNITSIGDRAFKGCKKLKQVFFMSKDDMAIGSEAFSGCTNLSYVSLPLGTTSLGDYCFENCTAMDKLTVPDTVTKIGANPWQGCDNLTVRCRVGSVAYQNAVKYIPEDKIETFE